MTYSDTPEQNASCTGRVKDTSTDGSPNMSYAEYPRDGATKALDFTVQLTGGSNLNWPTTCDSTWATFPEADRLLVGARMPIAVALRNGIYELSGDHEPDMHAHPFSYPVDDFAPRVVKQATPHQSSRGNDGQEISTSTEDLKTCRHAAFPAGRPVHAARREWASARPGPRRRTRSAGSVTKVSGRIVGSSLSDGAAWATMEQSRTPASRPLSQTPR